MKRWLIMAFVGLTVLGLTTSCSLGALFYNFDALPISGDGTYNSPDGLATLTVDGAEKILYLKSDDSYKNGYNYGYLLAPEIINALHQYIYWIMFIKYTSWTYDQVYDFQFKCDWETSYSNEVAGMLGGMQAKLSADQLKIYPPGGPVHDLEIRDLMLISTVGDWACSSFAVWGAARSDGSPIVARNFDYLIDNQSACKNYHLIMVHKGPTGVKWVGTAICGMVGTVSAMNNDGFCAVIHNTDYYSTSDASGWLPRVLTIRKLVENMSAANTPVDAKNLLAVEKCYQGNNILVCFSNDTRPDDDIAAVLEYDGYTAHTDGRVTLRLPSDNLSLPTNEYYNQILSYSNGIINVNHYLKRRTPAPPSDFESADRYITIKNGLTNAVADGNVTVDEAVAILRSVGGLQTLQSVVFEPNQRKLRIYLSDKVKGAYDCTAHDYTLDALFN